MNDAKIFVALISVFFALTFAKDPTLPVIPSQIFDVTKYGAIGDGKHMNTEAIQKAIDAASHAGGGTVLIPEGKFLSMPLTLHSKIHLQVNKGASIQISNDLKNYPVKSQRYIDFITAMNASDIEISGEGTIDGDGQEWWTQFKANSNMTHRPYMIMLENCDRVYVHGIKLINSPMSHLVTMGCSDVTIKGITINAPNKAPNTHGIDISGWNYLISDCTIDTGDDNIAVKPDSTRHPGNKNFIIKNINFLHGHGMSIGLGTSGGIEDLTVKDCTFNGTVSAIRIKSGRENGGLLQNILYENITITDVENPVFINDYYPESTAPKDPSTEKPHPVTAHTPINKNITIRNVHASNCPTAGTIRGLPEMPITDLTFTDVTISAKKGMVIYHAHGVHFIRSKITVESGDRIYIFDAKIDGLE